MHQHHSGAIPKLLGAKSPVIQYEVKLFEYFQLQRIVDI